MDKNIIICYSNKLKDDWKDKISGEEQDSDYDWSKMNDDIVNIEKEHIDEDVDEDPSNNFYDYDDAVTRDRPKRVLAYTNEKLLSLLSMNFKSSFDGIFKSCYKLWKLHFVWMVKKSGYWIPYIWRSLNFSRSIDM